ncbi:MAG: tetratricopeptide repeat protein [Deltaproteobacteria bacterium]|nr:tetratricopeptide repeat protein [Deltaproteobacteria bacterium]
MASTLARVVLFSFLFLLFIPVLTFAEIKTFIKEYTYQASEYDSKVSYRTLALEQVKRILLEELGTYLESKTEVKNFRLTKDQIVILTAGIVRTEIVDESWDGNNLKYHLRAKISADPKGVIAALDNLRKDREKTKELEDIRKKAEELSNEIKRLSNELELTKTDKMKIDRYNKAVKEMSATDLFEKGYASSISGNYEEAIFFFSKTIELLPFEPTSYFNRGTIYAKFLNNYGGAISDFDKVIELDPHHAGAYIGRSACRFQLSLNNIDPTVNFNYSLKDINKAIELDPQWAGSYVQRGKMNHILQLRDKAFEDFNKAIELDPSNAQAYTGRGLLYHAKGYKYKAVCCDEEALKEALIDYSKAIELNPTDTNTYCLRSDIYENLNQHDKAIDDLETAARMGDKNAPDLLRKIRIK